MTDYDVDAALKKIFESKDGKDKNWKPSDIIPLIEKEIEFLKNDLIVFLDTSDYNIPEILKESKIIYESSLALTEEMNLCRQEIEEVTMLEMVKSLESHRALHRELEKINFAISTTSQAAICGKFIKEFEEGREDQSYRQAMEAVYDLVVQLEKPNEGFSQLDLFSNTKSTAQLILDSLLSDLNAEWNQLVEFTTTPSPQKTITTIVLNLDTSPLCHDVLTALDKCKKLKEKISEFSQFLLKDVFIQIINNDCTVYAETEELMTLTVNHKPDFKPPYGDVITNLRLSFDFLSNKFNYQFGSLEICLMKLIGEEISEEFCKVLVRDCFIDTIPNNLTDLQSYGNVTSEIQDFQNLLLTIKFFDDDISVLHYVNDMDQLFSDKSSQYFLETARSILVKDLSDTMSIGLETIPEDTDDTDVALDENTEEALDVLQKTIPKSLFYFPRCMISKSAQELLDLVYILMEQAVQCPDVVSEKLYTTARLIFELYDAVVPYHHENYLMNIPQYVALFHNNCMYLAHNLQTFGDKWMTQLEGHEPAFPIGFTDLVPRMRDLGHKHLTLHLQHQRTQILDSIRNSDLNSIGQKDSLGDSAEVAVRQCLRQLQILKNVWIGVFPPNVFAKVMGTLVELVASELCHRVVAAEDVPAAAAAQLAALYCRVLQRAPALFQEAANVEGHVGSWGKLQQVVLVLEGSLKDIESAWRGAALGALGPHELRALVKALFQNTHARAQLLQQIH